MEASQHPFEPLLLERPEDADAATDEFGIDGIRPRVHRDNFSGLIVHPDQTTVQITSLDPLGTELAPGIPITIRTRILRQLGLPGLELLLSIQSALRLLKITSSIDMSRNMVHP